MKTLLLGTAALFLASTSAHAVVILIDDFSTDQGPIGDTTPGDGPVTDGPVPITVGGNNLQRTISIDLLTTEPPEDAVARVSGGVFDVVLGTGDDAEARLIYDISELSDDFDALGDLSALALLVELVGADGTFKTLEAVLNGESLGVFELPDLVTEPTELSFVLDPELDVGGELEFLINGSPGYDIAFRLLGFEATPVPAPAMLSLFGLGLAGVAFARTRTRRA